MYPTRAAHTDEGSPVPWHTISWKAITAVTTNPVEQGNRLWGSRSSTGLLTNSRISDEGVIVVLKNFHALILLPTKIETTEKVGEGEEINNCRLLSFAFNGQLLLGSKERACVLLSTLPLASPPTDSPCGLSDVS